MTRDRENGAENLSDVIELIRRRRQSGQLSVEHIQGGLFEEGEIYFRGGQPIYARQGQLNGSVALTRMLNWHQVYFAFLIDGPQPVANLPVMTGTRTPVAITTDPGAQSIAPSRPAGNNTGPLESRVSEELPGANTWPISPVAPTSPLSSNTPGLEWLIPQKRGNDRNVLSLPLTRPQRSIYLLIDGKRTISDLARCTRKSFQEIERLLSELQERGLINI